MHDKSIVYDSHFVYATILNHHNLWSFNDSYSHSLGNEKWQSTGKVMRKTTLLRSTFFNLTSAPYKKAIAFIVPTLDDDFSLLSLRRSRSTNKASSSLNGTEINNTLSKQMVQRWVKLPQFSLYLLGMFLIYFFHVCFRFSNHKSYSS